MYLTGSFERRWETHTELARKNQRCSQKSSFKGWSVCHQGGGGEDTLHQIKFQINSHLRQISEEECERANSWAAVEVIANRASSRATRNPSACRSESPSHKRGKPSSCSTTTVALRSAAYDLGKPPAATTGPSAGRFLTSSTTFPFDLDKAPAATELPCCRPSRRRAQCLSSSTASPPTSRDDTPSPSPPAVAGRVGVNAGDDGVGRTGDDDQDLDSDVHSPLDTVACSVAPPPAFDAS